MAARPDEVVVMCPAVWMGGPERFEYLLPRLSCSGGQYESHSFRDSLCYSRSWRHPAAASDWGIDV